MNDTKTDCGCGDYIVIKAMEDDVYVDGITKGPHTRIHNTITLHKGEVLVAQFTEITAAMKVKGEAVIYTGYGEVMSETK